MKQQDVRCVLAAFAVCTSLSFIWWIYSVDISKPSFQFMHWVYKGNIRIYVTSILILIVTFLIGTLLFERIYNKSKSISPDTETGFSLKHGKLITAFSLVVISAFFFRWIMVDQFNEQGVINGNLDNLPTAAWILCLMLIVAWLYWTERRGLDISNGTLWFVYGMVILWVFLLYYVPNQFNSGSTTDWSNNIICSIAATETMYNAVDGVPYTISTTGLYGHYSFFLALPMWLLGKGNPYAVGITLAIVASVAQISVLYVIHSFLQKNYMKAIFALASMLFVNFYFAGCYPIRTFWPAVTCGLMTYFSSREKVNRYYWIIGGVILSGFGLVWNFENGIACVLGLAVFVSLFTHKMGMGIKIIGATLILSGVMLVGSIIVALIVVNIWNLFCGGKLIVGDFFYPLLRTGNDYMLDLNRCNVDLGNHLWVYILILLFGSLCLSFHKSAFDSNADSNRRVEALVAGYAAMGIIAFSYYMNEAHWGATYIVHYILICLCAVLAGEYYNKGRSGGCSIIDCVRRACYAFIWLVVLLGALNTINVPVVISEKVKTKAYNMDEILMEIETMKTIVPENTYGVGIGINIIYHIAGWDNHARYRDVSSLNSSDNVTYDVVLNEIGSQNEFVISELGSVYDTALREDIQNAYDYVKMAEFSIGGITYGYYRRE